MTLRLEDVELEPEMKLIKKEDLGFYIFLGKKLLDVLMLQSKGPSNPVKIPLSPVMSEDKITIITKSLGANETSIGSISIPQYIILNGGLASYTQWITLFEHQDDDEYDGQMGANDDEAPRILVTFVTTQNGVLPQNKKQPVSSFTNLKKNSPTAQQQA